MSFPIWFVKKEQQGKVYGPISMQQLQEYVSTGKISAQMLVSPDKERWYLAEQIMIEQNRDYFTSKPTSPATENSTQPSHPSPPAIENSTQPSHPSPSVPPATESAMGTSSDSSLSHYQIIRELGRGGMGVVYQAMDTKLKRVVAVKMLLDSGLTATNIKRFMREAELSAKMSHPNIVTMYDFGAAPSFFIIMEFIEGRSFNDIIGDQEYPLRGKLEIFRQVCEAIAYAHKQKIIHRDLKPQNIMVTQDHVAKIMDFGLAKSLDIQSMKLSKTGHIMGTIEYMSPEQAEGRKLDHKTDIYSLGVILYQILTGRTPYTGENAVNMLAQLAEAKMILPCALNPNISKELQAICMKCMEKNPDDRYETAQLLGNDIQAYIENKPISISKNKLRTQASQWKSHIQQMKFSQKLLGIFSILGVIVVSWLVLMLLNSFPLSPSQADLKKTEEQKRQELTHTMSQVKQAIENKNYETARRLLDNLIAQNPDCEMAYLERAKLFHQLQQAEEAIKDLACALELRPCLEYAKMQSQWLEEAGYLDQAYVVYTRLLEKFPDWSGKYEIIQAMANLEFKLGQYQQSYQSYTKLPPSPSRAIQLARCSFHQQDYNQCEKHIQEANGPLSTQEQAELRYYEGHLWQQKGNIEASIAAFLQALQLQSSQTSDIYWQLGKLYCKNKQNREALDWLQKAAPEFPKQSDVNMLLAQTATEEKKFDIAIQAWSQCIQLEPWQSTYYHARSRAYCQLQNWKAAEEDLLKCLQISGEDLEALFDLFLTLCSQDFLAKVDDLKMFFSFLNEDHVIPARLFLKEETEIFTQYIQDYKKQDQQKQHQHLTPFDAQQANSLIQGLVSSDFLSVQNFAQAGLLRMYQNTKLHDMLANEVAKPHSPLVKQRLQSTLDMIKNRYFNDCKTYLRYLLVRYYSTKDHHALQIMFSFDKITISYLLAILQDNQEPEILRFLAARMLIDLKHPEGYQALQQLLLSNTDLPMVYAYILFSQQGKNPPLDPAKILPFTTHPHPFVRALLAKYLPYDSYQEVIQNKLIHDNDVRVRILAADRLRSAGKDDATAVLWAAYQDPNPEVRTFVVYSLWDFTNFDSNTSKEQSSPIYNEALQNLPKLIQTVHDPDAHVRRAALIRMEQWQHPEVIEAMGSCLNDVPAIRLQAVISLGTTLQLKKISAIMCNPNEEVIFRLAALLGMSKSIRVSSITPQIIATFLPILEEKNPYMRLVVFLTLGRSNQKFLLDFMKSRLTHSDPQVRLAAVIGLTSNNQPGVLPAIEKMLNDHDPAVRFAAAVGYTTITGYFYPEQMPDICKKIAQTKDEKIIRGGALGFNKILYDCIPYHPDIESQWDWKRGYINFLEQVLAEIHKSSSQGMCNTHLSKPERSMSSLSRSIEQMTAYMDAAVEFAPDEPRYRLERGVFYFAQKKYMKAVSNFEKAAQLAPDASVNQIWLAYGYYHTKKYKKGIELVDRYLKSYPWSASAYNIKRQLLEKMNQKEEAKAVGIRQELMSTLKATSGL